MRPLHNLTKKVVDKIEKIYADKGYYIEPNRSFLNINDIEDRFRLVEHNEEEYYDGEAERD